MTVHLAKRAIVMAAGKGTRLLPYTENTPKPLLQVKGQRMIDAIIRALHSRGIHEIYIVTGYLKEQFETLPQEYPGVTLIHNPYFDKANNISSLFVARAQLEDVILMDGDQLIENEDVLDPVFEGSCYCAFQQQNLRTREWILELTDGIITKCHREGGVAGWQLQSVSFWTKEDALKLQQDLEELFIKERRFDLFWDDIALFERPERYRLGIRKVKAGDILEIDTVEELRAVDAQYDPTK